MRESSVLDSLGPFLLTPKKNDDDSYEAPEPGIIDDFMGKRAAQIMPHC